MISCENNNFKDFHFALFQKFVDFWVSFSFFLLKKPKMRKINIDRIRKLDGKTINTICNTIIATYYSKKFASLKKSFSTDKKQKFRVKFIFQKKKWTSLKSIGELLRIFRRLKFPPGEMSESFLLFSPWNLIFFQQLER